MGKVLKSSLMLLSHNMLLHNMLLYNMLLHNIFLHNMFLHNMLLHNMLLHNMLLHNMLLHNMFLHNMLLHNMLLHNMLLHNMLLYNMFLQVWEEMELKEVLKGHSAPVWDVAIYPGAGIYLSASGDKTIRLWRDGEIESADIMHFSYFHNSVISFK